MPTTLRAATAADRDAAVAVINAAYAPQAYIKVPQARQRIRPEAFDSALAATGTELLLAVDVDTDAVQGTAMLNPPGSAAGGDGSHVAGTAGLGFVAVDPALQRQGIAGRLMAAIEQRAVELGFWRLEFAYISHEGSPCGPRARSFYLGLGYHATGQVDGPGNMPLLPEWKDKVTFPRLAKQLDLPPMPRLGQLGRLGVWDPHRHQWRTGARVGVIPRRSTDFTVPLGAVESVPAAALSQQVVDSSSLQLGIHMDDRVEDGGGAAEGGEDTDRQSRRRVLASQLVPCCFRRDAPAAGADSPTAEGGDPHPRLVPWLVVTADTRDLRRLCRALTRKAERVLEIGCSFGRCTRVLCRSGPPALVVGVDSVFSNLGETAQVIAGTFPCNRYCAHRKCRQISVMHGF